MVGKTLDWKDEVGRWLKPFSRGLGSARMDQTRLGFLLRPM